jgi:hypothetical protein
LSVEQGTEQVPHDGRYYVLKDRKVLASFRSLKQAQELFQKVVRESGYKPVVEQSRKSPGELAADRYLDAKDWYWAESHKYREKGGRGGRGGV